MAGYQDWGAIGRLLRMRCRHSSRCKVNDLILWWSKLSKIYLRRRKGEKTYE